MSYCVNCGVELADTERVCPLCGTEVINPRAPWTPPDNPYFSEKHETAPSAISRRFIANIICALLLVPLFVTMACDIVASNTISWSLYVIGGVLLGAVCLILPMYFKRYIIPVFVTIDAISVALYLYLIEQLSGGNWFLPLALPLCIASCGFSILWATLFKNHKVTTLLVRIAVILFTLGVFIVLIELIINAYNGQQFTLKWSQYVLIPCSSLTLSLLLIDSNKKLKEAMRRRLFLK